MPWLTLLATLTLRALLNPWARRGPAARCLALRHRHWYRRFPFLPLPAQTYLKWRMYTAYGREDAIPPADDVISFARWVGRAAIATLTDRLLAQAYGLGFDAAGIAALGVPATRDAFDAWLAAGLHGTMAYLDGDGATLRRDARLPHVGARRTRSCSPPRTAAPRRADRWHAMPAARTITRCCASECASCTRGSNRRPAPRSTPAPTWTAPRSSSGISRSARGLAGSARIRC